MPLLPMTCLLPWHWPQSFGMLARKVRDFASFDPTISWADPWQALHVAPWSVPRVEAVPWRPTS